MLSNALLNVAVIRKCTIIHKYLTVGYTQMEADDIHSCISSKVKNADINLPSDYVNLIRDTKKHTPYIVEYLT